MEELRQRRARRFAKGVEGDLDRLDWERREIQAEYRRVSETYARHLERLSKKANRNVLAIAALRGQVEAELRRHLEPSPQQ